MCTGIYQLIHTDHARYMSLQRNGLAVIDFVMDWARNCHAHFDGDLPISFKCLSRNITACSHSLEEKQDSQCTCNLTLRLFQRPLLQWENKNYYISLNVCARMRVCGCMDAGVRYAHVALSIQHATCRHSFICHFSGSTILFDINSQKKRFMEKRYWT